MQLSNWVTLVAFLAIGSGWIGCDSQTKNPEVTAGTPSQAIEVEKPSTDDSMSSTERSIEAYLASGSSDAAASRPKKEATGTNEPAKPTDQEGVDLADLMKAKTHGGFPASHWVAQLEDKAPASRLEAIDALEAIKSVEPEVLDGLVGQLSARESGVGERAAEVLRSFGRAAAPAVPKIGAWLKLNRNPSASRAAAYALGGIDPEGKQVVPILLDVFEREHIAVQDGAVRAFREIGEPAFEALENALDHPNKWVRMGAARALAGSGWQAPKAAQALAEILHDQNPSLRRMAAVEFRRFGPDASDAVPHLVEALDDQEWAIRRAAVNALGHVADPDDAEVERRLRMIAASEHPFLAPPAKKALARLAEGRPERPGRKPAAGGD